MNRIILAATACAGLLTAADLPARRAPATPVVAAAIQDHRISGSIQLPGSVKTLRKTQVAAPVAGLVVEMLVRDGDKVERNQVIARLATDALEARRRTLEAEMQESQARLHGAATKADRARELFEAQVIAAEQLDDSRFEQKALEARLASLKAQIAEIDLSIRQSVIKAPFDGAVSAKLSEVGQWVRVGDPLVEVLAVDELEVVVDVPELHFSKLRLNQTAELRFEALPGVKLRGAIDSLSPVADPEARTFPVKISVPARNGQVRPGMVAEVTFAPSRPRDVLIAPKDALVEKDTGWVVFEVQSDDTVEAVPVRLGESVDAWTEVSGDLSSGDQVVILGNERLRSGQSVRAQLRELPKP